MQNSHELWFDSSPNAFSRNCFVAGAVALFIYECLITHDEERRLIWRCVARAPKYIYLFARYFTLACQLLGLIFVTALSPRYSSVPGVCKAWYHFLAIQMQLVLICIELILMLRVYALYNQCIKIGVLLVCILCMSNTAELIFGMRSVRGTLFDVNCMALDTPRDVARFGVALLFTHTAIFTLTVFKRNVVSRTRWSGVPIIRVMVRDAAIVFGAISVLGMITIPYAILVRPLAHYLFPWFTVFPSIVVCRLIINMQRLHDPLPSPSSPTGSSIELSTDFASASNGSTTHVVASRWPGSSVLL